MNVDRWYDANNRYLAASLKWLRLKVELFASQQQSAPPPAAPPGFWAWLRALFAPAPEPAEKPDLEAAVAEALAAREAAAEIDPPPSLLLLAQRFELSTFERDILLMCAALDLDPSFAALCARAQGAAGKNFPTFGLALSLLDDPSWDALSPHRPLRLARLLELGPAASASLTAGALRADERIVNFLKGLNAVDERLSVLFRPAGQPTALAPSQRTVVNSAIAHLRTVADFAPLPVVQLIGGDDASRAAVAAETAKQLGRHLYRAAADSLPSTAPEVEQLARLWQRETVLLPVALYWDAVPLEGGAAETGVALQRFLQRESGLVFVGVRETPLRLPGSTTSFDLDRPTPDEQFAAWMEFIPAEATAADRAVQGELLDELLGVEATPEEAATATGAAPLEDCSEPVNAEDYQQETARLLAGQFNLNLREIEMMARSADPMAESTVRTQLWRACRDMSRPHLDQLAQRLQPKATWDDLVLPEEQLGLIRQVAGQARERFKVYGQWGFRRSMNRGFGINALFAGESGTGKTMAAEVLANELDLNLYRIDLSAVVSKYIGETEKNLRRLFDAAEQGGAILLFDEADALFGKRSEVRDSHDRYANIEINYLLQRIEAFNGVALLATNMRTALDPAFMRRLRFVVTFPFPSAKERKAIWQRALPTQLPREALDFDRLARMNLSGGNIHSIALNAAFAAAQNGQRVTMPIILTAARMELKKLERPFNEAEFR